MFDERSEFGFEPAHFEAAYAELERTLYEGHVTATVIAPVLGIALDPDTTELPLGDGLSLIRGDALADAPAEAVWGDEPTSRTCWRCSRSTRAGPTGRRCRSARARFRRVLTRAAAVRARRLRARARRLGAQRGGRLAAGADRGAAGRPRLLTLIPAAQEDELRAF